MMVQYYIGGENKTTIQKLLAGETVIVKGKGNSMTPKLKSGEAVIVEPITPDTMIKKRSIFIWSLAYQVTHIKYPITTDMITDGLSKSMVNMLEKPQLMN